jgi:hypothetical protein
MQGHIYIARFSGVAVTVAQDLFQLLASATVPIIIHEIRIGQSSDAGDAQAEMARIQLARSDMTINGSGGTTVTPVATSPGSPAAATVVEANNTTLSTVQVPILSDVFNVQANWLYVPTPETRIIILPTQGFIIALPDAPNDSLTMSGSVIFEEIK